MEAGGTTGEFDVALLAAGVAVAVGGATGVPAEAGGVAAGVETVGFEGAGFPFAEF